MNAHYFKEKKNLADARSHFIAPYEMKYDPTFGVMLSKTI